MMTTLTNNNDYNDDFDNKNNNNDNDGDDGDDDDDNDEDDGNLSLAQVLSIRKWVSHRTASKVQTNAGLMMQTNIMNATTTTTTTTTIGIMIIIEIALNIMNIISCTLLFHHH